MPPSFVFSARGTYEFETLANMMLWRGIPAVFPLEYFPAQLIDRASSFLATLYASRKIQ